jgi:hypothetical protein
VFKSTNAVRHKVILEMNEAQFERISDRIDREASHAADHLRLLQGLVKARKDSGY